MAVAGFSWIIIGITSFLCGFGLLRAVRGKSAEKQSADLILVCGLCALTVYAQAFSLFYKVGAAAVLLLAVLCAATAVLCRGSLWAWLRSRISGESAWNVTDLRGPKGNPPGPKGNLCGCKGNLCGPKGNLRGCKGNLCGPKGNLPGSKGNLCGPKGNPPGGQERGTRGRKEAPVSAAGRGKKGFCGRFLFRGGLPVVLGVLLTGVVLVCASGIVLHYDTDLYHAQSIRWIEEYGAVKGLGNLHNRLAYNSAFFSLQALFSLKFVLGDSLHTVNGFITALMLVYGVTTLHVFRGEKTGPSDLFKLGLVFYFCFSEGMYTISSPGSDLSTLSMVLYLCAKWAEYMERGSEDPLDYGVLCLLAVWTVTLKLSAGLLVLLAVYPAVLLIKKRRWRDIAALIAAGVLILAPFLARNVVISGYLVYPYTSVDLFDVDWKMLPSMGAYDSMEIMAWGRGVGSPELYASPASVWIPVWYGQLTAGYKSLVWINMLCLLLAAAYGVYCLVKRRGWERFTLTAVCAAGLLMWFATSPLVRYGVVYMLLLPALLGGMALERLQGKAGTGAAASRDCAPLKRPRGRAADGVARDCAPPKRPRGSVAAIAGLLCLAAAGSGLLSLGDFSVRFGRPPLGRPVDYTLRAARTVEWEGITIYLPENGDQLGYHYFPGCPDDTRLALPTLRTGGLKDGFRVKDSYRGKTVGTNGAVMEEEV